MHRAWLRYPLIAALAVVPWLSALDVDGFVWESDHLVRGNPLLDRADVWTRAFTVPWAAGVEHPLAEAKNRGYWRPLATLDLALEHRLWDEDPRLWRGAALGLHAGLAAAFLAVLEAAGAGPAGPALAVAFAWHPLHGEVLGSVSYRTTAAEALFGLLALLLLVRGRGAGSLAAALGLALAGLLTKESAVAFLVVLPLGVLALARGPRAGRRAALAALGIGVLVAAWAWARSHVVEPTPGAVLHHLAPEQRMVLMAKVVALDAGILLWPAALNPHYDVSLFFPPLVDARTWAGLALAAGLAAAAGLGLWRRQPWAWALIAAAASLGPVSGLVPLRVLAADRFLVLPLALLLIAAVLACKGLRRPPRTTVLAVLLVVATLGLAALGARSAAWIEDWRGFRPLMEARVRDFPRSVDARLGLGDTCRRAGEFPEAREHVAAALEVYPGFPPALDLRARIDAEDAR